MSGRILCALLVLAMSGTAFAQVTQENSDGVFEVSGASKKTSALEFRLGGYKPLIERESALGTNPYNATFGNSAMLLFEVEYDRQFFQRYGSLGLGVSAGYAEKYGAATALVTDADGNLTPEVAAKNTGFKVAPLRLVGVYRADYAALRWGIPIVPYVKGGLVYTLWWVTEGAGVEYAEGQRAAGGKWGFQGSLGISIMLDVLEPRLARDFDTDLGVNHSYFFAEYTHAEVNGFGQGGLDLSSRHWMFGLTLEY